MGVLAAMEPTVPTVRVPGYGGTALLDEHWSNMVAWAARVASGAHAEQRDKMGQPYILHPTRVALRGTNGPEMVLGYLHDVLEDCERFWEGVIRTTLLYGTEDHLDLWDALIAITHIPNEPNRRYIARVAANPLARVVKVYDIHDNFMRIGLLEERDRLRITEKYTRALEVLEPPVGDWHGIPLTV